MYMMSACLAGCACRYDGGSCTRDWAKAAARAKECVLCCPEQLGGLGTPREPAELTGDGMEVLRGGARVMTASGRDVTRSFLLGAYRALALARHNGVELAVLKSRSPSCGCAEVYDGTFSGALCGRDGVTAALLNHNGIECVTEDEFERRQNDGQERADTGN
ncbi:MAG: DUF523 domain-containing protein [Clostridia bacterium]|nr:DUF523 domain-containing protein [Clostridia bacterium]